jgi:hypothetical protein
MSVDRVVDASDPVVSVVVPSLPWYDHTATIDCLRRQSVDEPYEVLLVEDADLDRSAARNRGLRAARADVVALTDDDTRPPGDWLATVHRQFTADPDLVCLEGEVYGGARSVHPRRYVGCNLAVRREAALAVGGFRSDYAAWAEDIEFGWRMEAEADGHCRYEPAMRMRHPSVPRTSMDREAERRLREEYPERYNEVLCQPVWRGLYRRARLHGLTQPGQRLLHRLRRLVGGRRGPDVEPDSDRPQTNGRP